MKETYQRINQIIAHYGITLSTFCKKLGHNSTTTISKIIHEKRNPSSKTIGRIINAFPEISYDWLVSGEGEMLRPNENVEPKELSKDEMTVTASQIANFMKEYYPYTTAESEKRIVDIIRDAQQQMMDFLLNTYPQTPVWSERVFKEMDLIKEDATCSNQMFLKMHSNTHDKIEHITKSLDEINQKITNLDILIETIEKHELIEKEKINKFLKSE